MLTSEVSPQRTTSGEDFLIDARGNLRSDRRVLAPYSLEQRGAPAREFLREHMSPARLGVSDSKLCAVFAEIRIRLQDVALAAQQQLQNDGIVEQTDHFDVVRNQIIRIAEVD